MEGNTEILQGPSIAGLGSLKKVGIESAVMDVIFYGDNWPILDQENQMEETNAQKR